VPVPDAAVLTALRRTMEGVTLPASFLALDLAPAVTVGELVDFLSAAPSRLLVCRRFGPAAAELVSWTRLVRSTRHVLAVDVAPGDLPALAGALRELGDDRSFSRARTSAFRYPVSPIRHQKSRTPLAPTAR